MFFVGGSGAILGLDLVEASFTYNPTATCCSTSGSTTGRLEVGVVSASGDVFILHGDFGADRRARLPRLPVRRVEGGRVVEGDRGLRRGRERGRRPDVLAVSVDIHPTSCHISDFAIAPPPPGARAAGDIGRSADVRRRRGPDRVDLKIDGVGGPPNVVLVDPSGQTVTPQPLTVKGAAVVGGPTRRRARPTRSSACATRRPGRGRSRRLPGHRASPRSRSPTTRRCRSSRRA